MDLMLYCDSGFYMDVLMVKNVLTAEMLLHVVTDWELSLFSSSDSQMF